MEDVFLYLAAGEKALLTTADLHERYMDLHSAVIERKETPAGRIAPLVESVRTSLGIAPSLSGCTGEPQDVDSQPASTEGALRAICAELGIKEACKRIREEEVAIPNPPRMALLSLLSSYQQLLSDKFQYEHMLELARAARLLASAGESPCLGSGDPQSQQGFLLDLDTVLRYFGHALVNRYGTSIALSEVSDISVEWRGDVHDMLSVMSLAHEAVIDNYHAVFGDENGVARPATLTVVANVSTATRHRLFSPPFDRLSLMRISGMHLVYPGTIYQVVHEIGHFAIEYYHPHLHDELQQIIGRTNLERYLIEEIAADVFSSTLLETPDADGRTSSDDGLAASAFWLYYQLTAPPGDQEDDLVFQVEQATRFTIGLLMREAARCGEDIEAAHDRWRTDSRQGQPLRPAIAQAKAVHAALGDQTPSIVGRLAERDGATQEHIEKAMRVYISAAGRGLDLLAAWIRENRFLSELPRTDLSAIARAYYAELFQLTAGSTKDGSRVVPRSGWRLEAGGEAARRFFALRVRSFLQLWEALLGNRFSHLRRILDSLREE